MGYSIRLAGHRLGLSCLLLTSISAAQIPLPPTAPSFGDEPEYDLVVTHIKFNWRTGTHDTDAIELREDRFTPLETESSPYGCEWVTGDENTDPVNEPSFWVDGPVTIIARFKLYLSGSRDEYPEPCTMTIGALSSDTAHFGNIEPKRVHFTGGDSDNDGSAPLEHFVRFTIDDGVDRSVERELIRLTWFSHDGHTDLGIEIDDDERSWQSTVSGQHKMYTTPNPPGQPWNLTAPGNSSNPWTLALDYCIDQAQLSGCSTEFCVADDLAWAVFLERRYNSAGRGRSNWSYLLGSSTGVIDLQGWLTNPGVPVNCYDQAFATMSLCNLFTDSFVARHMPSSSELVWCIHPDVRERLRIGYGYFVGTLCGHGFVTNPFYEHYEYNDDPTVDSDWFKTKLNSVTQWDRSYFASHCWFSRAGLDEWDSTVGPVYGEPLPQMLANRDTSAAWEAPVAGGIDRVRTFATIKIE